MPHAMPLPLPWGQAWGGGRFLILHYSCERLDRKRTRPATQPGPQSRRRLGQLDLKLHRPATAAYCIYMTSTEETGEGQPPPRPVHAGRAGYCPAATTVLRRGNPPSRCGQVRPACASQHAAKVPASAALRASSRLPASGWCNLRCCTAHIRRRLFSCCWVSSLL